MDLAALVAWKGREQEAHDVVTATPVQRMRATLDLDTAPPQTGDPLPPLWHWFYCVSVAPLAQSAIDGHPRRGGFLPPVPLPRRMWAGGRLEWLDRIVIGDDLSRKSMIEDVTPKSGRSGELVFVVVRHEYSTSRGVALREWHDIVYRGAAPAVAASAPATPPRAEWERSWTADDVMLFRYSALTFNSHRIHYDRRYVTHEEGYRGLIVHGPLMATLLMGSAMERAAGQEVSRFSFRALRSVFDGQPFQVCGKAGEVPRSLKMWIRECEGHTAMEATAEFKS